MGPGLAAGVNHCSVAGTSVVAASRWARAFQPPRGFSWPGFLWGRTLHTPAQRPFSVSLSCLVWWNKGKMVIMPQTSSGKGSEADEKPYLRVRPLLLKTRSEAVNSADTAITGNEPAPVPDPRLPGCGMGTGERGWMAVQLLAGSCLQPLGQHGRRGQSLLADTSSIWAHWDDFLAFLGRSEVCRRGPGARVSPELERKWLRIAKRLRPG